MVERSAKRQKKNFVSEEDISTVLQRYTATTVLALLQEVAQQVQGVKIDWNALVKKTTTGISSAREYQMLWRHLAYRDSLIDRLDDAAQLLDDDSDLDCELEAFPAVSSEASAEAAACVKVLIASGVSNDPTGSTVEGPLTISMPRGQTSKARENSQSTNCTLGTNITVPISVQKQPMPFNANAEGLDSNGGANPNLPRRRRKPWSHAEDMELIAAVQKCGEGNWANILKGDFKGDRTASQLSQRWNIIKKKNGNLNVGTGSQISDVHLATRRAVDMALGKPTMPSCSIANAGVNSNAAQSSLGQPTPGTETGRTQPSQHDSVPAGLGPLGSSKARVAPPKKPSTKTTLSPESTVTKSNLNPDSVASKSTLSPDSLVKATAVIVGARIGTASDAASLVKAAQSKNAVHIMPGGSLIKSSVVGSSNSFPSNVHYICTGLVSRPTSSYSSAPPNASQVGGTHQMQGPSTKSAASVVQPSSGGATASDLSGLAETKGGANSDASSGHPDAPSVEKSSSNAAKMIKELVLEGQTDIKGKLTNKQIEGDQNAIAGSTPMDVDASRNSPRDKVEGCQTAVLSKSLEDQAEGDKVSAAPDAASKAQGHIDSSSSGQAAGNGDHNIKGNDKTMSLAAEHNGEIPSAIEKIHENGSSSAAKEGAEEMVVDGSAGEKCPSQQGTSNGITV